MLLLGTCVSGQGCPLGGGALFTMAPWLHDRRNDKRHSTSSMHTRHTCTFGICAYFSDHQVRVGSIGSRVSASLAVMFPPDPLPGLHPTCYPATVVRGEKAHSSPRVAPVVRCVLTASIRERCNRLCSLPILPQSFEPCRGSSSARSSETRRSCIIGHPYSIAPSGQGQRPPVAQQPSFAHFLGGVCAHPSFATRKQHFPPSSFDFATRPALGP